MSHGVHQFIGSIGHFFYAINHVIDIVKVTVLHIAKPTCGNCSRCEIQFKVFHIRGYFHIVFQVNIFCCLVIFQLQTVCKSWKCGSDHNALILVCHDFSTGNFHIFKLIPRKHEHGRCKKWNFYLYVFTIDIHRPALIIRIVKPNFHLAAFSCQIFRLDFLAVQIIGYFCSHRKLLIRSTFIGNVFPFVLPCDSSIRILRIFFVTFRVFDVFQIGKIHDLSVTIPAQPVFDRNLLS